MILDWADENIFGGTDDTTGTDAITGTTGTDGTSGTDGTTGTTGTDGTTGMDYAGMDGAGIVGVIEDVVASYHIRIIIRRNASSNLAING